MRADMTKWKPLPQLGVLVVVLYVLNIIITGDVNSAKQSMAAIQALVDGAANLGEETLGILFMATFFGYIVYKNNS